MKNPIDIFLKSFCSQGRKDLSKPHKHEDWILASNAYYGVEVPADMTNAPEYEGVNLSLSLYVSLKSCQPVNTSIQTEHLRELLKSIPKVTLTIDCPECDGEGFFGDGDCDPDSEPCIACDGTGESNTTTEEWGATTAIVLNGISFPPQYMEKLLEVADFFKQEVIINDHRADNAVNRFKVGPAFYYCVPVQPHGRYEDYHCLKYEGIPFQTPKMSLQEWIVRGEVGISSKTIWAALTGAVKGGIKGLDFDVPKDPDDFRRCRKLVQQCQLSTTDLQQVKVVFPWYAPFIDNWDKLNELYGNPPVGGTCDKLYDYMQTLNEESMVLAGWERTGINSWKRKIETA